MNPEGFDKESVLRRLRAAQKLAEQATNENEAWAAAQAVQRILERYQLDMEDISEEVKTEINPMSNDLIVFGYKNRFDDLLSYNISSHNFTFSYWTRVVVDGETLPALKIVGRKENVQNVIWLFNNLKSRAHMLVNNAFERYKASGGVEHGKSWKLSWLIGFNRGLKLKLDEQTEEFQKNSRAVVVYQNSKKENMDYARQLANYNFKGEGKKLKNSNKMNIAAWQAGVEQGKKIELQKGIPENKRGLLK